MSSPRAGGNGAGHPRVLIVEPNGDMRLILAKLLEHEGFAVTATDDPDHALELAVTFGTEVMIGEHPLPLSDGRFLCAALLEDARTCSIPFVAVTARALPEDLACARTTHLHGVFAKPVAPRRVLEHVKRLLGP